MKWKEWIHHISQHVHITIITTVWLNVFSSDGCNSSPTHCALLCSLLLRGGVCAPNPWIWAGLWLFVPTEYSVSDAVWLPRLSHGRWCSFWIVPWTMCSGISELPVRRWTALRLPCCEKAKLLGGAIWRCSGLQSPAFQSPQTDWRHESKWTPQRILAPTCLSFPSRSWRHHRAKTTRSHCVLPQFPSPTEFACTVN